MLRRHELSDAEWELIEPLLPWSARGRKRVDDRKALNQIVWKLRTVVGLAGRARAVRGPGQSSPPASAAWSRDGTFERMLQAAQARIEQIQFGRDGQPAGTAPFGNE